MINTFIALLISLNSITPYFSDCDKKDITVLKNEENLLCLECNDISKIDDEYIDYFKLSNQFLEESEAVIIQDEYISFNDERKLESENNSLHPSGKMRFITKAYSYGFTDGHIIYHIETTIEQYSSFENRYTDQFVIRHGDNAITLTDNSIITHGKKRVFKSKDEHIAVKELDLNSTYAECATGIVYDVPYDKISENSKNEYEITGDYYVVATDYTAVQPVLINNHKKLIDSFSLEIGKVGISIDLPDRSKAYYGTPLNLKGFNDRITSRVHVVTPSMRNFEERYYFENEGIRHTELVLDDFIINTSRLRCGFIKNKVINLSPNRKNAGDAYLELKFNKPIYLFGTSISLWSITESMYNRNGDYLNIEIMDSSNSRYLYKDIQFDDLSKDLEDQDYYEFNFYTGIYGIRFNAHKEHPDSINSNKGRISFGDMKFNTVDLI